MSRSKSKVRSRKPPKRRKRPSHAAATTEPVKVWPEKLIGAKYVRLLEKQLRTLQAEDAHGNRRLFLDDARQRSSSVRQECDTPRVIFVSREDPHHFSTLQISLPQRAVVAARKRGLAIGRHGHASDFVRVPVKAAHFADAFALVVADGGRERGQRQPENDP